MAAPPGSDHRSNEMPTFPKMSTSPTVFLLPQASAFHDTGWSHPEHQGRLRAIASAVGRDMETLHGRVVMEEAREASIEELLRVHTPKHVDRVQEAVAVARRKGAIVGLDPDTRVSAASWKAALEAAGAVLTAVQGVVEGRFANGFVAGRPPGHHATPDRAMGFCLFNSVAVAVRWLQEQKHAEKLLIVDWDVHHGNGTQEIFYEDPSVFYLSLHQYPHFPGTGAAEERGEGRGRGTTLNVPLAPRTPRGEYLERFHEALEGAFEIFTPDFVLVSAGFDVIAGDPLGGQLVEREDMHRLTSQVMSMAEETCGGRLVATLEGGYDLKNTAQGALAVLRALCGVETPQPLTEHPPSAVPERGEERDS